MERETERELERWREKARKITEYCRSHLIYSQMIAIPIWFTVPCFVSLWLAGFIKPWTPLWKSSERNNSWWKHPVNIPLFQQSLWEELHICSLRYDSQVKDILTENNLGCSKTIAMSVSGRCLGLVRMWSWFMASQRVQSFMPLNCMILWCLYLDINK